LKKYRIKKISKLSVLDAIIGMNHAENHDIREILANVMLCNVQYTLLQLTHDIDAMRTFTKHTKRT